MPTVLWSLYSASQLPMIVAMKTWFRTDAQHSGERSRQQYSSVHPTSRPPLPRAPHPTKSLSPAATNPSQFHSGPLPYIELPPQQFDRKLRMFPERLIGTAPDVELPLSHRTTGITSFLPGAGNEFRED